MEKKRILITGAAGFVGFHAAQELLQQGHFVVGLDSFNDYYEVSLKEDRATKLKEKGIEIVQGNICTENLVFSLCEKYQITHLLHLAAYAGVRYSLKYPQFYIDNNIQGFYQILEAVKQLPHIKLIYASSSSVYGKNKKVPFAEEDMTEQPANMYGMSKKSNELMAYAYHNLYGLDVTGLRFFTVYGPWGRPDMAYFHFTRSLFEEKPIDLYNFGKMKRDFTYIDDIVQGISRSIDHCKGCSLFNLGNNKRVTLEKFVSVLEELTGKKAQLNLLPMPKGEIEETYASIERAREMIGYEPKVAIEEGLYRFVSWFSVYYRDKI